MAVEQTTFSTRLKEVVEYHTKSFVWNQILHCCEDLGKKPPIRVTFDRWLSGETHPRDGDLIALLSDKLNTPQLFSEFYRGPVPVAAGLRLYGAQVARLNMLANRNPITSQTDFRISWYSLEVEKQLLEIGRQRPDSQPSEASIGVYCETAELDIDPPTISTIRSDHTRARELSEPEAIDAEGQTRRYEYGEAKQASEPFLTILAFDIPNLGDGDVTFVHNLDVVGDVRVEGLGCGFTVVGLYQPGIETGLSFLPGLPGDAMFTYSVAPIEPYRRGGSISLRQGSHPTTGP